MQNFGPEVKLSINAYVLSADDRRETDIRDIVEISHAGHNFPLEVVKFLIRRLDDERSGEGKARRIRNGQPRELSDM
jgi:hypothetical protein